MIILFDGVCNLCNRFVQFVLKHDKQNLFRFASLQSSYGESLQAHFGATDILPDSIILFDGEKIYTASTAILKILKELNSFWSLAYACIVIPRPIRDIVYKSIAKTRYRIFGKRDSCMIPKKNVQNRFIDSEAFYLFSQREQAA